MMVAKFLVVCVWIAQFFHVFSAHRSFGVGSEAKEDLFSTSQIGSDYFQDFLTTLVILTKKSEWC